MSEQLPEKLHNDCQEIDFGDLKLYAIVHGKRANKPRWSNQYPFIHRSKPSNEAVCSVLWRGCVAHFRLLADGRLRLERYEYPYDPRQPAEAVDEILQGHFWLLMKSSFFGDCTYVPFVDGRIVTDRERWVQGSCDVDETSRAQARAKRRRSNL